MVGVSVDPQHDGSADGAVFGVDGMAALGQFVADALIYGFADGQGASLFKGLLAVGVGVEGILVMVGGEARGDDRVGE